MFVIGRALHEQIQIGNSITIKVLRIGDKHVTLGIDAPRAVPLSRSSGGPPPASLDPGCPCDLNVLIVDSTPIHAWLIQKAFNAYGAGYVHVARTAKEALALLGVEGSGEQSAGYDLVIAEVSLPDMTGHELLRRIRSVGLLQTLPIIMMSYQDADSEVSRVLEAGATAFVPKPETQEGFRQAVFRIADFWGRTRRVRTRVCVPSAQESLVC